jgi:hypothetical protein
VAAQLFLEGLVLLDSQGVLVVLILSGDLVCVLDGPVPLGLGSHQRLARLPLPPQQKEHPLPLLVLPLLLAEVCSANLLYLLL